MSRPARFVLHAGLLRRAAAGRRRRASTPRSHPDGLERRRRADGFLDSADERDRPTVRFADYAARASRRAARPAASPGSSASWSCSGWPAVIATPSPPSAPTRSTTTTATRRGLTWAPGTATGCTSTATRRSTGRPAHLQAPRPARLRAGRGRHADGAGSSAYAVYLAVIGARGRGRAGAADLHRSSGWSSRCPFVRVRACCCRSSPGPAGRGPRPLAQRGRAAGRVGAARQGHPGRARQPHPRRHHRAADCCAGLERLRLPAAAGPDHGLHGPLPRRGHRRDAPDADGARVPRLHRPQPAALAGRWPGPRARCSSAPTSAANGSTSRCCPAATPGPACAARDHAVLDVRGLAYAYPDGHQALYGVDLHVHRGERVALLGPNGAGKTTLVLHLNGILTAGAGSVTVSGLPVTKENLPEIRRRVGIVFQDPDDQLFMRHRPPGRRVRPGQPRPARRRAGAPGAGVPRQGRHGRLRRPAAAPPLLRPAAPGRGRDRAGHGARDPGARRAVVQPRPGVAARARRDPARRSTSPC